MSGSLLRRPQRRPHPSRTGLQLDQPVYPMSRSRATGGSALGSTGAAAWPPCSQDPGHGSRTHGRRCYRGHWGPGTYPDMDFDREGMSEAAGSSSLQTQASLGDATPGGEIPYRTTLPTIGHGLSQAPRVDFIHQAVRHIVNETSHTGSRSLSRTPLSSFLCEPGFLQGLGDVTALGSSSDDRASVSPNPLF